MYNIANNIFGFFSRWDKITDSNKDVNDKGTLERFNEVLGSQWDDDIIPFIDGLLDNTLIPSTVLDKFIPYLEALVGLEPLINDLTIRRKFLENIIPIYKVKGTKRSYEIVFKLLGFDSVNIVEEDITFGFDSPITFDDEDRTFDLGKCYRCGFYTIELTGTAPISTDLAILINNAIDLVEPIHAKLKTITYNGNDIHLISTFVDTNGDLKYTTYDENVVKLILMPNGDLHVLGTKAHQYSLKPNGDLVNNS